MELTLRRAEPVRDFFTSMRSCFTPSEWKVIDAPLDDSSKLKYFFIHWTLKESYIKAVGIGLGFELHRAQFNLSEDLKSATIEIDGILQKDWRFEIHEMPDQVISVAYGPVSHTTPNFRSYLAETEVTNGLEFPIRMVFKELTYEQIVEGCDL